MYSSKNPALNNNPITIPISINVGLIIDFKFVLLIREYVKWQLRDKPIEYATSSIAPNGDAYKIAKGGILSNPGMPEIIAVNANPVDQAVYIPHATPNPGMNIGSAADALLRKIPKPSTSEIRSSKLDNKTSASSSLTSENEPI